MYVSVFQAANGLQTGAIAYIGWNAAFVKTLGSMKVWLDALRAERDASSGSPEAENSAREHRKRKKRHEAAAAQIVEETAEVLAHWSQTQEQREVRHKQRSTRARVRPADRGR